jgi:hypothetical protein
MDIVSPPVKEPLCPTYDLLLPSDGAFVTERAFNAGHVAEHELSHAVPKTRYRPHPCLPRRTRIHQRAAAHRNNAQSAEGQYSETVDTSWLIKSG